VGDSEAICKGTGIGSGPRPPGGSMGLIAAGGSDNGLLFGGDGVLAGPLAERSRLLLLKSMLICGMIAETIPSRLGGVFGRLFTKLSYERVRST
jgi:hypothetical protein